MKTKWTTLLILMICIGLIGCGSTEDEDTQMVSAVVDDLISDMPETDEETLSGTTESDEKSESASGNDEAEPDSETDSDEQPDADDDAADEEAEEDTLPTYEVTALEEPSLMYASTSVNVRQGPSTDFEIVGSLKTGREVTVTGRADTGWYEILYNEDKVFVSDKYLLDEKPVEEPVLEAAADTEPVPDEQPQETAKVVPVTEVKNVAGVIFVGDSRFVQMKNSVGENPCTWIAESSKGYKWLNENAVARIDNCVGKGSKILINLGVNDPGNLKNYLALVNTKADEWAGKGATVYYASVNPVWDNPYVTEEQVEYFNSQMQSGLNGNVHWIDSHTYLNSIGYKLVDGLHYNNETYQNLYAYFMSCM